MFSKNWIDWYNLAVIAQEAENEEAENEEAENEEAKNEELACYSLGQVFQKLPATEDIDAWRLYVHLLKTFNSHRELSEICNTRHREISQDETLLLLKTAIYLFKISGQEKMAIEALKESITNDEISISYLRETLNHLKRKPTEGYQSVVKEISYLEASHLQKTLDDKKKKKESQNRPFVTTNNATDYRGRKHKQERKKYKNKKSYPRLGSTSEATKLFHQALEARVNRRYSAADQLFQQAINKGGGPDVYEAFIKTLQDRQEDLKEERARQAAQNRAQDLIQQATKKFPWSRNLRVMYGQLERKNKNYEAAKKNFQQAIEDLPKHKDAFYAGLAQVFVDICTDESLRKAGQIYKTIKFNKDDGIYKRFLCFKRYPRIKTVYQFFQSAGMQPKTLKDNNRDIVVSINTPDVSDLFGLTGDFLVRSFRDQPKSKTLNYIKPQQYGYERSLAFILVPKVDDTLRDILINRLVQNEKIPIIPLDDSFFQEAKKEPLNAILGLLNQYLGLRDLYNSAAPVSGRRFFGRERLLLELTDEIHSGAFLGIYGLRKIGKTSLLHELRDEKLSEDAVTYVDLQTISGHLESIGNCNPLYWALERDLYTRLRERNQELTNLLRLGKKERFSDLPDNGTQAPLFFAEDIRAFLQTLEADKNRNIKRLVILIDELELILPGANKENRIDGYIEFFHILRGLAQTHQDLLSCVVVAANAAISENSYWEGRDNPVFALYNTHYLPPFPQNECAQMIRDLGKGMSVHWDEDAISAVFAETNGHPFLTRIFCSHIAQKFKDTRPLNVKADLVQDQIGDFIRYQGDKLNQIIALLEAHFPEEKKYLENIALEESPPKMPDEALRHLMGYHLIEEKDGTYRITLNLLRRWLRRRAGIRE